MSVFREGTQLPPVSLLHHPQKDGGWCPTQQICIPDNGKEERESGRGEAKGASLSSRRLF